MSSIFRARLARPSLPLEVLSRASLLFKAKGWPLSSPFADADSRFDTFCAMLSRLTPTERDLVLTLTEDFLYCVLIEEEMATQQLARHLDRMGLFTPSRPLFAVPLFKRSDVGKMKSGPAVLYALRTILEPLLRGAGVTFAFHDRPEELKASKTTRRNAVILFVDDFLGSGRTASETISEYRELWSSPSDTVVVAALIAQERAQLQLSHEGIQNIASIVRTRGISDSLRITNSDAALDTMRALSRRLGVSDRKHLLGHNRSESLVSLRRCPNNTFPVYWTDAVVGGDQWPATFQR